MCVLLEFLQKTSAIPIMNPLSWFMIQQENDEVQSEMQDDLTTGEYEEE